ncbi:hypothetical protein [Lunatimonas salinarum]|uniref:hypothetical protein n=1 Tax=Lunatimonas salinarum TaxID=1774590 RepID=UPI001AE0A383|nr:hypothetical protein [Lunatimonas salinarum]
MRKNEYWDIPAFNPYFSNPNLKKPPVIEEKINNITLLGNSYLGNNENALTDSEINSMSLLFGSYKREINRLRSKNYPLSKDIESMFSSVSKRLYKLPFEKCAVEINSDDSMKFTLSFSNDKLLMISKSSNFEDLGMSKDQVIYSFFINRKLISSDVTNLETFTKNFKGYLSL